MSEPGEKGTTIVNKRCRKLLKIAKCFTQNKTVKSEMRIVQVVGKINNGVLYF